MMEGEGFGGAIVVGIDNGPDRMNELCPPWGESRPEASGDKYAAFIIETVKPYIDENYNTLPGREHTGVGGASMGGVQSLYMGLIYPEIFSYAICFSPAQGVLFSKAEMEAVFDGLDFSDPAALAKLYLFCGGVGDLEVSLIPGTEFAEKALLVRGYPGDMITYVFDEEATHNEVAWAKHFPAAFQWGVEPVTAAEPAGTEPSTETTEAPADTEPPEQPDGVRLWFFLQIGMIVLLAAAFVIFVIRVRKKNREEGQEE